MKDLAPVYFASGRSPADEALRLQRLDSFYAAPTRAWLQQAAGLKPGMAVAEFGPGSGRMLDWFAGIVGRDGDVLGVDIDLSRAGPVRPPVRLMQADLHAPAAEPGAFDLVYARMVLGHLSDPDAAIARLLEWLRPGGRIALADLDCSRSLPEDMSTPGMAEFAAAMDATRQAMDETSLMDSAFGGRLAGAMKQAGVTQVNEQRFERVVEGGSDWALFQAENVEIIAGLTGAHEASAITARYMRTPGVRYHDQALVFCTGIRP
ncbi:MAG: class I SAM-dependent methyltransferase [Oceanicaulis sp.]|nr:class I SAM-dependent methyltransferase [Oceanicaulis sp.]